MTPSPTLPAQESALPAPCPFCGGINILQCNDRCHLTCWACGCEGADADDSRYESALAAWNRRATPPIQQGVVEALEMAYSFIRDGVEFGYIKDTTTPDWRKALREIRAALASFRATSGENGNG